MGKMTYKKLLGVVMISSLLVGVSACNSQAYSSHKVKNNPVPKKIIRNIIRIQKPPRPKLTEAFVIGQEGTFEALGETKRVIWDEYPDQLAYVKDAFYHWTIQDDWFQVNTGHYMLVDRLNSSGALLRKLEKGTPVKLDGNDYKVIDYKDFEGNGSADKLLVDFKEYIKTFPKTAYFIQTCLDARTYGGQRLVVLDAAAE
ncbi:hypothetical protein GK675_04485 [Bifidobacteriaceae bacterium NR002]|nr:hypothetical protein [Bifidobacteriaceae bacterium NR002]MDZ7549197.1 hypothetical protein [Bifidobacteriaceae bacterium NR047]